MRRLFSQIHIIIRGQKIVWNGPFQQDHQFWLLFTWVTIWTELNEKQTHLTISPLIISNIMKYIIICSVCKQNHCVSQVKLKMHPANESLLENYFKTQKSQMWVYFLVTIFYFCFCIYSLFFISCLDTGRTISLCRLFPDVQLSFCCFCSYCMF